MQRCRGASVLPVAATGAHQPCRVATAAARCSARKLQLRVVAFKDAANMRDWRTQRMVETAKTYYSQVLSKGDAKAIELVLDESVVYRDNVWRVTPVVGRGAFQRHLAEQRHCYPDALYEVDQMGLQDDTHLFVLWTCHETNIDSAAPERPASHHASVFQGVDVLAFSADRAKVVEVNQFRQPTAEEKGAHHQANNQGERSPFEIKLVRLVP